MSRHWILYNSCWPSLVCIRSRRFIMTLCITSTLLYYCSAWESTVEDCSEHALHDVNWETRLSGRYAYRDMTHCNDWRSNILTHHFDVRACTYIMYSYIVWFAGVYLIWQSLSRFLLFISFCLVGSSGGRTVGQEESSIWWRDLHDITLMVHLYMWPWSKLIYKCHGPGYYHMSQHNYVPCKSKITKISWSTHPYN